ncbi:uncharacterized protein J7T54_003912 [Emericellopsis cladophorae]|uniref:NmrA-like domain-containing protein n=1 Tax=Emericellopsis cladophorae TaxID=2686198 RepID=A0A9P9Y194_9HYPO|nr:uncharacterized protein J7T54_003912 [Emericellopsis cladophorae]KAI6781647.1 hypothetical protein J7T54_003912 [Emericellopsis cladophorae]
MAADRPRICLVGANGNLGSVLLPALLDAGFPVTVLHRSNSTNPAPLEHENLSLLPVDKDFPIPEVTEALKPFKVVVAAFPLPNQLQLHLRLAYAAASAGVERFMPADFGSCDAASPEALKRLQLYRDKVKVRERCEELAREFKTFSWTALVCGHFFDWGLRAGFLHFDIKKQESLILDGGDIPASASTLRRVGEATVAVLNKLEETKNKTLYVQSFNPSQNQVLVSLEKATGAKWKVSRADSQTFLEEQQKKVDAGDRHAVEDVVFALGAIDADWTKKDAFAMELLDLEDEDLDQVVKQVVDGAAG